LLLKTENPPTTDGNSLARTGTLGLHHLTKIS
jgi:hypothetical protein